MSTQNWASFSGGCMDVDALWYACYACPNRNIRFPVNGCLDYIIDCYDALSYTAVSALNGSRACGCCIGDIVRGLDAGFDITVKSATTATANLAGYSLWFGDVTGEDALAHTAPIDFEGSLSFRNAVGNPRFGFAFNVEPCSTITSFTGLVFLIDYDNGHTQIVQYTAQNLRTDTPTVLQTSNILPLGGEGTLFIANAASAGTFDAELWDSAGNVLLALTGGTGYVSVFPTIGVGPIWIGKSTTGVLVDDEVEFIRDFGFTDGFQFAPTA